MAVSLMGVLAEQRVRVGWRTNIAPAWEFDLAAIGRACDDLAVYGDVEVGCAEYPRGRWAGMYSYERGIHRVRVGRRLSLADASRVLWHELTHAAQTERGETVSTAHLRGVAYYAHPLEVEARANEPLALAHPLVIA